MAAVSKTSDVFISHSLADSEVARDVAHALEAAGLTTFHLGHEKPASDLSDAIWEALSESRALIAIVSPEAANHAMGMVEIGAATAWNKPVFLIIDGPSSLRLPAGLQRYPVYPLSRVDEVVSAIRTGFEPLSDDDKVILTQVYEHEGVSVDQLSLSPGALRGVSIAFNERAMKQFSGERILSELFRLRKRGQLRLKSKGPLAG